MRQLACLHISDGQCSAFNLHRCLKAMRMFNEGPVVRLAIALLLAQGCASSPSRRVAAPMSTAAVWPQDSVRASSRVPVRCVTLADAADSARAYRRLANGESRASTVGGTPRSRRYPDYDVVLDVPVVCVDQLALKTDTLRTKFVLDTRVTNLVRVNAGADILMENVDVSVKGVHAKALLLVDLTEAAKVVDQTLTFIDNHPEALPPAAPRLLLLGATRNLAGQTVQRLVNASNGDIIERTVASVGEQVVERSAGNVAELAAVDETKNAAGTLLIRVRDPSGAVVTFARDARGHVSEVTVRASSPQ